LSRLNLILIKLKISEICLWVLLSDLMLVIFSLHYCSARNRKGLDSRSRKITDVLTNSITGRIDGVASPFSMKVYDLFFFINSSSDVSLSRSSTGMAWPVPISGSGSSSEMNAKRQTAHIQFPCLFGANQHLSQDQIATGNIYRHC
jgi:hypothetical protein